MNALPINTTEVRGFERIRERYKQSGKSIEHKPDPDFETKAKQYKLERDRRIDKYVTHLLVGGFRYIRMAEMINLISPSFITPRIFV